MADDIENVAKLLRREMVWDVVQPYIGRYKKQVLKPNDNFSLASPTSVSIAEAPNRKKQKLDC